MFHRYDVVIVGAGGAGLAAALYAARSGAVRVAVLSKMLPVRSHTGTAQGGIGAALGNHEEDHPEWHVFDTIKGSDYLADQDAVRVLCYEAVELVYELEHMGLPFDRTPSGRIAQRPFGGHTNNVTKQPVRRACHAADRTGHMILQTLYQQCLKHRVTFFDEFQVLDVILSQGVAGGVVALEIATGQFHVFHARAVILATGGWGRVWQITSNAHSFTGDGAAIVLRHGIPLEDMEFFQFHPTGIYKLGILVTEGARGEGGVLINGRGERFMARYAPNLKDLASRDVISRAIYLEIREGRGVDGKDYVHLDIRPETINHYFDLDGKKNPDGTPRRITAADIQTRLPDITDFVRTYLGIDPLTQPIPVQPTAHYAMGGIPTDLHGRVVVDAHNTVLPGLYAAGEVACVSVHGANRLGTNSLVDILVFGRRSGLDAVRHCRENGFAPLPKQPEEAARAMLEGLRTRPPNQERIADIRAEMQRVMMDYVGVFREATGIEKAIHTLRALQQCYQSAGIHDKSRCFNTELLEAWELGCLLDLAEVTAVAALARTETRGCHTREDYPQRDDANWLKHSLAFRTAQGIQLQYKPVTILDYPPQERIY
ncbi:MAG: FAD-dependent oxidoreductase [Anaerolineae bacterium]|nr:FAD-dependent oxidoreductase [Anaerolineae bacterium]MDW8070950.1 FAD-dependent oxidoreductase [Anaerolineae bacterium]